MTKEEIQALKSIIWRSIKVALLWGGLILLFIGFVFFLTVAMGIYGIALSMALTIFGIAVAAQFEEWKIRNKRRYR